MPAQKIEGSLAVDDMASIKIFDLCAIRNSELCVKPPHLGVFVSNPLIGRNAVAVPPFNHEWPRRNQRR